MAKRTDQIFCENLRNQFSAKIEMPNFRMKIRHRNFRRKFLIQNAQMEFSHG